MPKPSIPVSRYKRKGRIVSFWRDEIFAKAPVRRLMQP
jgi:hypothetical protein